MIPTACQLCTGKLPYRRSPVKVGFCATHDASDAYPRGYQRTQDNLQAAIYGATRTGAVVDGTVRDLEGLFELPAQIYFRDGHPAAVSGVTVIGINIPVKIGEAIVMPGDVVLGDRTGIMFIPPQLVKEIVEKAELTHIHDEWTKAKFLTGKYKASELYGGPLSPENQKEYDAYVKQKLGEKK